MKKILYGIALDPNYEPSLQGRCLVVGEQVNEVFAVRDADECGWMLDHLPTGRSAGKYWINKSNAVRAAQELESSFRSASLKDFENYKSDPALERGYRLLQALRQFDSLGEWE